MRLVFTFSDSLVAACVDMENIECFFLRRANATLFSFAGRPVLEIRFGKRNGFPEFLQSNTCY